jgi:hypothetical protein
MHHSECKTCLVRSCCTERCYEKADQIYIIECINGHKYKRKSNSSDEYRNKCPECGTYFTGITAAEWL